MTGNDTAAEAVSLLQELGLQEYEARCFLALTQLPTGTAKQIHEISDVPRTRVYDAIRVLESQGLVEVQHSSPQQYRAVEIDEATQTLRKKYDDRIETLQGELESVEQREPDSEDDSVQEVWSLTGHEAVESRTLDLIDEAESEIALLVVDEDILSEPLFDGIHDAVDRDLSIILGGETDAITDRLGTELPSVRVFETELDWLHGASAGQDVAVSRILLIDRETLLIGTYYPGSGTTEADEQAIFARGLENGVVVLLRRLVSSGLAAVDDPGQQ
ncbi:TrmB family transcriptional regulator [Natronorubrum sp. JWXQ-INN-674]|uniref:TrmB family transcriptional regulator n=1 Tax=Natronorubrum halalkaliphilum TaxID=2691917 RepID=A0A6B0VL76_9EURY|nr:helix-turn-helix domain-containing protein [Natronorubrum halalkaliphilum]MXV62320.1 TrmB family transcriptional regulator [Natronorubrum halalkaliphilum]